MCFQLTFTAGHAKTGLPMRINNGNDSNQNHHYNNSITTSNNNNNNNISSSVNNNSSAINIINNNNNYSKKYSSSNGNIKTAIPLKTNNTTTNNYDDTDFVNNKTIILNKKDVNERHLKSVKVTEINENLMQNGLTNYKQLENDANRLNNFYNKFNGCIKNKMYEKTNNDESVIKTNGVQHPVSKITNGYKNGYSPIHQTNGVNTINPCNQIDRKIQSPQTPTIDTNRTHLNSPLRYSQNGTKQNGFIQSRYSQNGLNNKSDSNLQNSDQSNNIIDVTSNRYGRKQSVTENKIIITPDVVNCQNEIILNGVSHNYVRQNDVTNQNGGCLNGNSTNGYNQNDVVTQNGAGEEVIDQNDLVLNNGITENIMNGSDCTLMNGIATETEKNKLAGR